MPQVHDLRSFIEVLEAAGQLVRIRRTVSLDHELAAVAAALERQNGPAPLFESVAGSPWPVFASSVASQERAALALGCEKGEVTAVMQRALDPANGVPPVRVAEAAWKANVITGPAIDVNSPASRTRSTPASPASVLWTGTGRWSWWRSGTGKSWPWGG